MKEKEIKRMPVDCDKTDGKYIMRICRHNRCAWISGQQIRMIRKVALRYDGGTWNEMDVSSGLRGGYHMFQVDYLYQMEVSIGIQAMIVIDDMSAW